MEQLLPRAEQRIEGLEFNRVLYELRGRTPGSMVYEIVVTAETALAEFLPAELPKMTEHFFAKRLPIFGGGNSTFIVLWRDDHAHLFSARTFFTTLGELLDADEAALARMIHLWRRHAGFVSDPWTHPNAEEESPVALLPAPKH